MGELRALHPNASFKLPSDTERRMAHYVAYAEGRVTSREAAASLAMRKAAFLAQARDRRNLEMGIAMDDDLIGRLWRMDKALMPDPLPSRMAVWKTERTGEYTTRGQPKLRQIGAECYYGGEQLHRSPPVNGRIQRWRERDLLGLPIPGDWGTKPYGYKPPAAAPQLPRKLRDKEETAEVDFSSPEFLFADLHA